VISVTSERHGRSWRILLLPHSAVESRAMQIPASPKVTFKIPFFTIAWRLLRPSAMYERETAVIRNFVFFSSDPLSLKHAPLRNHCGVLADAWKGKKSITSPFAPFGLDCLEMCKIPAMDKRTRAHD
jgi:hypothetical protein